MQTNKKVPLYDAKSDGNPRTCIIYCNFFPKPFWLPKIHWTFLLGSSHYISLNNLLGKIFSVNFRQSTNVSTTTPGHFLYENKNAHRYYAGWHSSKLLYLLENYLKGHCYWKDTSRFLFEENQNDVVDIKSITCSNVYDLSNDSSCWYLLKSITQQNRSNSSTTVLTIRVA